MTPSVILFSIVSFADIKISILAQLSAHLKFVRKHKSCV
jgi:hypothetical protein